MPDLFPGAVATNLISGKLNWFAGLKIIIVLAVIASMFEGKSQYHCRQKSDVRS